jgi:hypothetical protein
VGTLYTRQERKAYKQERRAFLLLRAGSTKKEARAAHDD